MVAAFKQTDVTNIELIDDAEYTLKAPMPIPTKAMM